MAAKEMKRKEKNGHVRLRVHLQYASNVSAGTLARNLYHLSYSTSSIVAPHSGGPHYSGVQD